MKRVILPFIVACILIGCKEQKQNNNSSVTTETVTEVVVTEQAVETDPKVDSYSGATGYVKTISLTGIIVLPPEKRVMVSLSMGGIVRSTHLVPGALVQKGSVILTLENPEFIELQQFYKESEAKCRTMELEYKRQTQLMAEGATTEKKLEESKSEYIAIKSQFEAAKSKLELLGVTPETLNKEGLVTYLSVKAPITGYVANVDVNPGKYVEAGSAMCEIIDKSAVMLRLTAYEKDLADIAVGNKLTFEVNGVSDQQYLGEIVSIGQNINEQNRSIEVYAAIKSKESLFRPGMYVTANIDFKSKEK